MSGNAATSREPELWQRVDEGRGIYRWLVWEPGPMATEAGHWFETEEEARECLENLT